GWLGSGLSRSGFVWGRGCVTWGWLLATANNFLTLFSSCLVFLVIAARSICGFTPGKTGSGVLACRSSATLPPPSRLACANSLASVGLVVDWLLTSTTSIERIILTCFLAGALSDKLVITTTCSSNEI